MKESSSEFLGFRIKAVNHGSKCKPKYAAVSHIKDRSLERISEDVKRLIHKIEFPGPGKRSEHAAVIRYNFYVLGVHNYFSPKEPKIKTTRTSENCKRS